MLTVSLLSAAAASRSVVYGWCSRLPAESGLKCTLDWVLCALCHLRPTLLRPLLHTMGALVLPGDGANATDDRSGQGWKG